MLKHNRNELNNLYVTIDSSDDHFYTLRSVSCQNPTCDKNIYAGPTWPIIITDKYIKAPIHSSARLESYVYWCGGFPKSRVGQNGLVTRHQIGL